MGKKTSVERVIPSLRSTRHRKVWFLLTTFCGKFSIWIEFEPHTSIRVFHDLKNKSHARYIWVVSFPPFLFQKIGLIKHISFNLFTIHGPCSHIAAKGHQYTTVRRNGSGKLVKAAFTELTDKMRFLFVCCDILGRLEFASKLQFENEGSHSILVIFSPKLL